jgi:hypothetical protein
MTTAAEALAEKAAQVAPGSFRHTVLQAARRFKATWAELGKLLVQVRNEALFEEWGYDTFEGYCLKELHIRRQTAEKLVRSFSFLARREPEEVERTDFTERAPAWEVVEVLADADERGELSAKEYKDVRESIWNAERPVAELRRELLDRFPKPAPAPPPDSLQLRRLAGLARKLAAELAASRRVPKAVAERAAALAGDIEELAAAEKER